MDNTTVDEKAKELIEKFRGSIAESDFHVPEFISGVDMKSPKYAIVYAEEEISLAKQCALICVQREIDLLQSITAKPDFGTGVCVYVNGLGIENTIEDYKQIKSSIEKQL